MQTKPDVLESQNNLLVARSALALGPLRHIAVQFDAERAVWADWLPVFLGLGIAIYFALPNEPPSGLAIGGCVAALLLLWLGWRHDAWRPMGWICVFLAAGFTAAVMRTQMVASPMVHRPTPPVRVDGWVRSVDHLAQGRVRVVLDQPAIERFAPDQTPARVRITLRGAAGVVPGNRIGVRAMLLPPSPPEQPGAFDFARQAFFERLGAVGFSVGETQILADHPPDPGWFAAWRLNRLRDSITLRMAPPGASAASAVSAALVTGERAGISDHVAKAWQDAGLAHLLAISGMNIGLAAGVVFFVVRAILALVPPLALRVPVKNIAAAIGILAAFGYTLISGSGAPATRSFLMTGLVFVAILIDRRALSMRLVSFSAAAILLIWPESLLSASFQMSFAAVAALVAAYDGARDWRHRMRQRWTGPMGHAARILLDVGATTIIASLATAPFALFHFNRLTNFGLLANLLAVPLTTFWITPVQVLVMAALPFDLQGLVQPAMDLGNQWITMLAFTVASWPGAVTLVPSFPQAVLGAMVIGFLWLVLWRRRWRWLGLVPMMVGLGWAVASLPPDLLVSADGRLIALRAPDGRLALSADRPVYTRDQWLRSNGQADLLDWPTGEHWLTCDETACLYRRGAATASIVRHPAALDYDCRHATIVINPAPWGAKCPDDATASLRYYDLFQHGAAAIWLSGAPRIVWVESGRGNRPWTLNAQSGRGWQKGRNLNIGGSDPPGGPEP